MQHDGYGTENMQSQGMCTLTRKLERGQQCIESMEHAGGTILVCYMTI